MSRLIQALLLSFCSIAAANDQPSKFVLKSLWDGKIFELSLKRPFHVMQNVAHLEIFDGADPNYIFKFVTEQVDLLIHEAGQQKPVAAKVRAVGIYYWEVAHSPTGLRRGLGLEIKFEDLNPIPGGYVGNGVETIRFDLSRNSFGIQPTHYYRGAEALLEILSEDRLLSRTIYAPPPPLPAQPGKLNGLPVEDMQFTGVDDNNRSVTLSSRLKHGVFSLSAAGHNDNFVITDWHLKGEVLTIRAEKHWWLGRIETIEIQFQEKQIAIVRNVSDQSKNGGLRSIVFRPKPLPEEWFKDICEEILASPKAGETESGY